MTTALRERLAALAHDQWSGWMRHMFAHVACETRAGLIVSADLTARWRRQVATPYADLSEAEKDSDRKEADKFLAIFAAELAELALHLEGAQDQAADWQLLAQQQEQRAIRAEAALHDHKTASPL